MIVKQWVYFAIPEVILEVICAFFETSFDSKILLDKERLADFGWLYQQAALRTKGRNMFSLSFELLFRASRDGYFSENFHKKCDKQGASLVIVETEHGHIVGGFTRVPWTRGEDEIKRGRGMWRKDEHAFIFVLHAKAEILKKYRVALPAAFPVRAGRTDNAVMHCRYRGPQFGQDLSIWNKSDLMRHSQSLFPDSFAAVEWGDLYDNKKDLITGGSFTRGLATFKVHDYEVFKLVRL